MMVKEVRKTRKLGGKVYRISGVRYDTKVQAKARADYWRKKGRLARVVPDAGKWSVYSRGKSKWK